MILPGLALALIVTCGATTSYAQKLDEMSLERWAKLSEVQRYQMQIAEKYYREKNYKVAAAEYEKYLTLYEDSEGASYSQLMWSICQVELRKSNTAIKEGFKTVIDYWPESPDAVAAGYYIGDTYRGMGRIPEAKKALREVLSDYPDHETSVLAATSLIAIAQQEKDNKTLVDMWKRLTFDATRNKTTERYCITASQQLAAHLFSVGDFAQGVKALAASFPLQQDLQAQVAAIVTPAITTLSAADETKAQGKSLADAAVSWFNAERPTDLATVPAQKTALANWMHIALVYSAANLDDQVPPTYERAWKEFDNSDQVLLGLANWYISRKRYDEARATFRRFQDKAEGLYLAAGAYRTENQLDLAAQTYNQAIAADPDQALRFKAAIAASWRGAKEYEKAIAVYEELIADDTEHADSWRYQMAGAYQDWGKYKEAIAHYRQCTNFPENYKQMAWCNRRMKNPQEAIILYNQVLAHEASAPWALLQIGYTREEADQKEQAIKTFQMVCKRFPTNQYASVAHAHLQDAYNISVTLGGSKDE
ncbi:tetratricopeptide repeat protein [Lignipirellula cremea]|nr:tetratricopeptide repeat protein [Lignipirellula cremea]